MESCDSTAPGGTVTRLMALALPEVTCEVMGDWVLVAACATADPRIFFPGKGKSTSEAKALCAACPVTSECREYSLRTGPHWGIWGGLDEQERKSLARRRKRQRARAGQDITPRGAA